MHTNSCQYIWSFHHRVVSVVTSLGAGTWPNCSLIAGRDKWFSLLKKVQIDHGAHPSFYAVGTKGSFTRVKWPDWGADGLPQMVAW